MLIEYDFQTFQALASIVFYTIHTLFLYTRPDRCYTCLNVTNIQKYQYLEFVDRGSLKLPSDFILEAFVTLYDNDSLLISVLVKGRSKISQFYLVSVA